MTAEEIQDRGTWGGRFEFLLSCIGFAVGLGNVWRFPFLAYRNGGATFLIPYAIMLVIAGLPLFFMELAVGQFASEGPITVWKVSPAFHGIGFAMVTISAMVCIYYNVIIMYAIYYMFVSFVHLDNSVPWETCDHDWNTDMCRTEAYPDIGAIHDVDLQRETLFNETYNETCVHTILHNISVAFNTTFNDTQDLNATHIQHDVVEDCLFKYRTASEEYWTRYVLRLHEADGFENLGMFCLKNTVCLFLAWVIVFFCLMKGIKSSGKVVYFTATFPYIILSILLVRGLTLDGYMKGIWFYVNPQFHRLAEAKVWGDAATQIFYSLGAGFGGLLTMASYNKFRNNCQRDAVIVAMINCGTSVFAGFAVFALLGHMAHTTNQDVEKVVDEGPGLVFIAYPEGIAKLPVSPLWAFLFFFMLLTLGLDSQFAMMETVISGISDVFPRVLRKHKTLFTGFCCLIGFLLGLPQVTRGGIYMLTLMDWYSGSYNLMLVTFAEIVCLMYVYGFREFFKDIKMMLGFSPNPYWLVTWLVLTPLSCLFIVGISAYQYTPAYYGSYSFPPWAEGIGWCMVAAPVAMILLTMLVQVIRLGCPRAFKPSPDWGPADPENRTGKYAITNPKGELYCVEPGEFSGKKKGAENPIYFSERL